MLSFQKICSPLVMTFLMYPYSPVLEILLGMVRGIVHRHDWKSRVPKPAQQAKCP